MGAFISIILFPEKINFSEANILARPWRVSWRSASAYALLSAAQVFINQFLLSGAVLRMDKEFAAAPSCQPLPCNFLPILPGHTARWCCVRVENLSPSNMYCIATVSVRCTLRMILELQVQIHMICIAFPFVIPPDGHRMCVTAYLILILQAWLLLWVPELPKAPCKIKSFVSSRPRLMSSHVGQKEWVENRSPEYGCCVHG